MSKVTLVRNPYENTKDTIVLKKRGRKRNNVKHSIEDVYIDGVTNDLPPYVVYTPENYKDGPEGFISWCEDNVYIPVYFEGNDIATWCPMNALPPGKNKLTGRSYSDMWEEQKVVIRNCLRMVNNRFVYRLIIFCWPRGEGKSFIAVLIQLWKFFNWTRQQIVLGANSKDQITFVHFDIMKDIIVNSPKLLRSIGKKNILEKHIRLKDSKGNITSVVRAISSFSGIVSNITGYTFSEMFDMKKPTFFTQLDGSIRNIPNALGVIDSTVSSKTHILYSLFSSFVKKESKFTYFSYRYSKKGVAKDYWNPNMTQDQLDDYKSKFLPTDFEKYFLNLWGSMSDRIFTDEMIESLLYIGAYNNIGNFREVNNILVEKKKTQDQLEMLVMESKGAFGRDDYLTGTRDKISSLERDLIPIENYYTLTDGFSPCAASIFDLNKLGDLFDTDWAILCGIDRADPMKESQRGARTIFTCVAKGLPGSRTHYKSFVDQKAPLNYIYFVLHLVNVTSHSTEDLQEVITFCNNEYDGIDSMCGERWGAWDISKWAEDSSIPFEVTYPSYDKQKSAFSDLFLNISTGRLKCPKVYIVGSKENDLLREEMGVFYHDSDKRWFGSPEKNEKYGVQDDVIFTLGWTLYGGRNLSIDNFRSRESKMWFGTMVREKTTLLGAWG